MIPLILLLMIGTEALNPWICFPICLICKTEHCPHHPPRNTHPPSRDHPPIVYHMVFFCKTFYCGLRYCLLPRQQGWSLGLPPPYSRGGPWDHPHCLGTAPTVQQGWSLGPPPPPYSRAGPWDLLPFIQPKYPQPFWLKLASQQHIGHTLSPHHHISSVNA